MPGTERRGEEEIQSVVEVEGRPGSGKRYSCGGGDVEGGVTAAEVRLEMMASIREGEMVSGHDEDVVR